MEIKTIREFREELNILILNPHINKNIKKKILKDFIEKL